MLSPNEKIECTLEYKQLKRKCMTQTGQPEKGLFARLGDMSESDPPWGLGEVALAIAVLFIGTLIIGTGITASASPSTTNPEPISFIFGWLICLVIVFAFVMLRTQNALMPSNYSKAHGNLYWESWSGLAVDSVLR